MLTALVRKAMGRHCPVHDTGKVVSVLEQIARPLVPATVSGEALPAVLQQIVRDHLGWAAREALGPHFDLAEFRFMNNLVAGVRAAIAAARLPMNDREVNRIVRRIEPVLRHYIGGDGRDGTLESTEDQARLQVTAQAVATMHVHPALGEDTSRRTSSV